MDRIHTKIFLQTSDSFLENKKNKLLLALYEKKYQKTEQIFHDILQYIKTITKLDENSEKLLNQIHSIVKKFSPDIPDHLCPKIKNDNRIIPVRYDMLDIKNRTVTILEFIEFKEEAEFNSGIFSHFNLGG